MDVHVRRIFDGPSGDDGRRILVDRLWPRGVSKADAALDTWLRDVAPSNELRRWYAHDRARFDEFRERYRTELAEDDAAAAFEVLVAAAHAGPIALLTATRTVDISHARVLVDELRARLG